MNFGMAILHQPLDYVLKMPVPFTLASYRNFMGTVQNLFKGSSTPRPKKLNNAQMVLEGKQPPEAWFKKVKEVDQF